MPRIVQIRTSYQADIGFLTRLSQAVERDPFLIPDEKRQIMTSLNHSALLFHGAEARRLAMPEPETAIATAIVDALPHDE